MEPEKDIFSKILTYLPFLTGLTVFFGMIKLITFYSYFNLNILSYLDLTELIFQTLKDFIFIGSTIIVGTFLGMLLTRTGAGSTLSVINRSIVTSKGFLIRFCLIALSTLTIIIVLGFTEIITGQIRNIILFITFIANISFFIVVYFGDYTASNKKLLFDIRIIYTIFLLLGMLFFAVLTGLSTFVKLKKNNTYLNNSIVINDKVIIKATPTYYYIGKTKNYVFFYNEKIKATDIYPMSTVSKLTINE